MPTNAQSNLVPTAFNGIPAGLMPVVISSSENTHGSFRGMPRKTAVIKRKKLTSHTVIMEVTKSIGIAIGFLDERDVRCIIASRKKKNGDAIQDFWGADVVPTTTQSKASRKFIVISREHKSVSRKHKDVCIKTTWDGYVSAIIGYCTWCRTR